MLKKVYIFEFNRSSESVADDYDLLSEIDKEKISDLDTDASFDYEDEFGNYNFYLVISELEFLKYKKLLDDNNIAYLCEDISNDILRNDINLSKKLLKYTNNMNENLYHEFINTLNDWISQNLELDIILDMINERGINSLRKVDKDFLSNYE